MSAGVTTEWFKVAAAAVGVDLVAQDATQPGAKLAAALEAVEAGEEGDKRFLHQIVGVGFGHTPSARHAVQHGSVLGDYRRQNLRIVAAEGRQIRPARAAFIRGYAPRLPLVGSPLLSGAGPRLPAARREW